MIVEVWQLSRYHTPRLAWIPSAAPQRVAVEHNVERSLNQKAVC
jgi:hypothetical protein